MAKKKTKGAESAQSSGGSAARPSSLVDTRVVYCGDNLDQLRKLPDACVDLVYIDPPFNSNRNYEVFWGETREKRAFEDRHASTTAYIGFMRSRPRSVVPRRPPHTRPTPDTNVVACLNGVLCRFSGIP